MRILLVHNYYQDRGGEDVYFDALVKLLKEKGHAFVVYTKNSESIKGLNGKVQTALGMYQNNKVENELTNLIQSFQPEIAHFNNIYPLITPVAFLVCKKLKIPIVHTIHTYRYLCPKGNLFRDGKLCELCVTKQYPYPSIQYGCYHHSRLASLAFSTSLLYHNTQKLLKLVDTFIFPAHHIQQYHFNHLPEISNSNSYVIPCFVEDIQSVSEKTRKENYFVFLGRLSEEKGILQLLDVFSSLPMAKLFVIGDGPFKNQLDKYKRKENIIFKHSLPQNEVYRLLAGALITVIPSLAPWYEVGPLVLYESFANGTPVLVPNAGVFQERVKNHKTGIFYRFNDWDDLRDKILYIIAHKSDMRKMRRAVRKDYKNKYSPSAHYRSLIQTYQQTRM